jgi:hypothetical protein
MDILEKNEEIMEGIMNSMVAGRIKEGYGNNSTWLDAGTRRTEGWQNEVPKETGPKERQIDPPEG